MATLCDECASIPWKEIATHDFGHGKAIPEHMEPDRTKFISKVSKSERSLKNSKCQVCQLLATAMPDDNRATRLEIFALTSNDIFNRADEHHSLAAESWSNGNTLIGVFDTVIDSDFQETPNSLQYPLVARRPFIEVKTHETREFGIREIAPDRILYHLVRQWMGYCKQHHGPECQDVGDKHPVATLRVIDCHSRSVIAAPEGCRYVALSYVWGVSFSLERSLREQFTTVVEDGIKAAVELGYDYLWVDKHCIDQDDPQDKHQQISQMDAIYAFADLTLVAASGNSANDGLPGVGRKPRQAQRRVIVGDVVLTQGFRHLGQTLQKSAWATRGWTFQEGCLSRRRLFFTDHQVYYACNGMYCSESVRQPLESAGKSSVLSLRHLILTPTHQQVDARFGINQWIFHCGMGTRHLANILIPLLEEYSARHLTFESDRLSACLGIFARLRNMSIGAAPNHIWGVPIAWDSPCEANNPRNHVTSVLPDNTIFFWIYWKKELPGRRNTSFPTWAWTGVSGSTYLKENRPTSQLRPTSPSATSKANDGPTIMFGKSHTRPDFSLTSIFDVPYSTLPHGEMLGLCRYMHVVAWCSTVPLKYHDWKREDMQNWNSVEFVGQFGGCDGKSPISKVTTRSTTKPVNFYKPGWYTTLPVTHSLDRLVEVYLDTDQPPPQNACAISFDE
ncbi:heterokaryon incompatibility protein-domain-containing protein, partial [Cercophora samala]